MKQLTEEEVKKIPEMRAEGMTDQEIANEYGVARNTITRWVKKLREAGHEIKRFPRGGRPKMKL
jgi:transposase